MSTRTHEHRFFKLVFMCSCDLLMIIDTHAHLDQLENLPEALKRAVSHGVEAIVAMGMNLESNRKNLDIKQKYHQPKIYIAMGMHPEEAHREELTPCLEFIRKNRQELCAIGEIGLDFWYKGVKKDQNKKEEQMDVFKAHLELAKEFDVPAVIHSRGAWKECLETAVKLNVKKAVFHWYSGPVDILKEIVSLGYFVSASPSLSYSPQSQAAIAEAPLERILIETDSPVFFKGMETEPGFKAEPKDVVRTLKAYCALKNVKEDAALRQFNQNAKDFFNLN